MGKILIVGGDIDVIHLLEKHLPEHQFVSISEKDARNHLVFVDEHRCPMGDFFADLCKPLNLNELNKILIKECIEIEAYQQEKQFSLMAKPNPSARYYHKFTQPYGQKHRNSRIC